MLQVIHRWFLWMDLQLKSVLLQALSITSTSTSISTLHLGVGEPPARADSARAPRWRVSTVFTLWLRKPSAFPAESPQLIKLDPEWLRPLCECCRVDGGPLGLQLVRCSSGTACWLEGERQRSASGFFFCKCRCDAWNNKNASLFVSAAGEQLER